MIFLPIVERELRVAARRPGTYWARFQSALAALVAAGFLLAGPVPFASRTQQGAQMFQILTFLAFIYALLAAVRLTADCLSAEKREGTLGLLFLTDLKPRDVVFGKLAATSCNAFYGLWALIPVLAIPLLLGGVTLADVLRLALVLGNTLFFALALALFVSALCWHEKKAVGMATLLLFTFAAVLPLASGFVAAISGRSSLESLLALASPGMACALVPERAYGAAPGAFWSSTAITHALGWMFLALTCRVLPRVWQDRPAEGRRRRWREWRRDFLLGRAAARAAFRRRLLAVNPVFWLASRERRTVWGPWLLLGSVGAIGAWACWQLGVRGVDPGALMFCSYGLNGFFKYWLATEAGHTFSTDRDKGALELLLCTPLNVRDVLRGHWLGLRRQFVAPVLTLLVVEVILFCFAFQSDTLGSWFEVAFFSMVFPGSVLVFGADLFALVWTGWWAGVVSKNASSAVSTTYFRLMILPWMAVAVGVVSSYVAFNFTEEGYVATGLLTWIGTSLAVDWFFARWARRKLLTALRGAAVERYSGGDPAMRWWRWLGCRLAERRTRPSSRPGCVVQR